jgi:hypothetical protein
VIEGFRGERGKGLDGIEHTLACPPASFDYRSLPEEGGRVAMGWRTGEDQGFCVDIEVFAKKDRRGASLVDWVDASRTTR